MSTEGGRLKGLDYCCPKCYERMNFTLANCHRQKNLVLTAAPIWQFNFWCMRTSRSLYTQKSSDVRKCICLNPHTFDLDIPISVLESNGGLVMMPGVLSILISSINLHLTLGCLSFSGATESRMVWQVELKQEPCVSAGRRAGQGQYLQNLPPQIKKYSIS